MHRVFLFFIVVIIVIAAGCAPTYVENIVTSQGSVIEFNGVRLEIPANSVVDSVTIRVEKRGVGKHRYDQGFALLGESYAIQPETLVFEKPIKFIYPTHGKNLGFGAEIGNGFVPLAGVEARGETLVAPLWHGGQYYLIEKPKSYGMIDHEKTDEGLLIVCDIYVSNYIRNFKQALKRNGYDLPMWLFVYHPDKSIEDNAQLLHDELMNLHSEYGDYRLDVVSFGIGGLVTHRYLTDSTYYLRNISSAVVAIGTPFFGSNFAIVENARDGSSPIRFVFIDGMANHAQALVPGSEFISLIKTEIHFYFPGYHYYDDPSETKNFVSLRGQEFINGAFPEETAGDGLVSLRSAMLTAIEPAAFKLNHFNLFENKDVHEVATDFVLLYRSFNWPMLFSSIWSGREPFSRINETWEREARLHFRDDADFEALLEYNQNMLESAPANALLITNGDYDTYPAWLLQGKGIRTDVLIVNRSLLNRKDYARFLKRQGLPLVISEQELDQMRHVKEDDKFVSISDQLMQRILKQTSRPVVFSTTVYEPGQYGYPLKLSGLVYEISASDIDVARTKQLLYEVFEFREFFSQPIDSFDTNIQNMAKNYAAVAFNLSNALDNAGKYKEAIAALEFAMRFGEEPMFHYNKAQIYFKMGERALADSALGKLLEIEAGDTRLAREVARIYHENGMSEKAVSILAGILENEPADKEILDLIKKYQGE
jgi:tetratricopeptide (TPR) repeat protein